VTGLSVLDITTLTRFGQTVLLRADSAWWAWYRHLYDLIYFYAYAQNLGNDAWHDSRLYTVFRGVSDTPNDTGNSCMDLWF